MKCPGCGKRDISVDDLMRGITRCMTCGADWRAIGKVIMLPYSFLSEGVRSGRIGDLDASEAYLRVSVGLDPSSALGWLVLGKVLAQQGRLPQALGAWKKARKCGAAEESIKCIDWVRQQLKTQPQPSPDQPT